MTEDTGNGISSIGLVPVLNVKDMSKCVEFYGDLGFNILQEYREGDDLLWVWLRSGTTELMLNVHDGIAPEERSTRPDYGDVVLYLYFEDARKVHALLEEKGWPVTEVFRQFYGLDEFYVRDPAGYEVAIASAYQVQQSTGS